jgi:peptide deformylase
VAVQTIDLGSEISELVRHDDPILRTPIPEYDFADGKAEEVSKLLAKTMVMRNGIGLAANQIGLSVRAFAMYSDPIIVCFNPKIVHAFEEMVYLEEGCLSFPGVVVKIKRPKQIRVRYALPSGDIQTKAFDGMAARVFQHELDHLNGIEFYRRAHTYHREKALKAIRKLR